MLLHALKGRKKGDKFDATKAAIESVRDTATYEGFQGERFWVGFVEPFYLLLFHYFFGRDQFYPP